MVFVSLFHSRLLKLLISIELLLFLNLFSFIYFIKLSQYFCLSIYYVIFTFFFRECSFSRIFYDLIKRYFYILHLCFEEFFAFNR